MKLMRSLRKLACWQSYALSQLRRCQPPPARTKGSVDMVVVLHTNLLSVVNSKFLSFAKAVISGITVTGAILHLQGVMA